MDRNDETPLDRLTVRHELWPYDPDDAERTEVVAVEHGGRRLEVIVPLLDDGLRVGEVVAAAVAGETVFQLGRYDRQMSDDLGTLGLLVVAVPHRDGRHRAVIAHASDLLTGRGRAPRRLGAPPGARLAGRDGHGLDGSGPRAAVGHGGGPGPPAGGPVPPVPDPGLIRRAVPGLRGGLGDDRTGRLLPGRVRPGLQHGHGRRRPDRLYRLGVLWTGA